MKTQDKYFYDWFGNTFRYGYGTGEQYTIPALKTFLSLCDEGKFQSGYSYSRLEEALTPTVAWLMIECLTRVDIIGYGTSPRYGWLESEGERLRDYVSTRGLDELYSIVCTQGGDECYPDHCNCPIGEECHNPFWVNRRTGKGELIDRLNAAESVIDDLIKQFHIKTDKELIIASKLARGGGK